MTGEKQRQTTISQRIQYKPKKKRGGEGDIERVGHA